MDIQAYIATGIIEDYALGIATPEQCAEVEELARKYPEISQEIEANKFALLEYILQHEETPPPHLKDKVWQKLQQLEEEDTKHKKLKIAIPIRWQYAASVVLLISSIAVNIILYRSWQKTNMALQTLQTAQAQEKRLYASLHTQYEQTYTEMDMLRSPHVKKIPLKGTETAPEARVWLYWNSQTQEVYVKVESLPTPPAGKAYQLWSIDDQAVRDAGMITGVPCLCHMKKTLQANAFAITLEKEGGVPKAEGKMYAIAKL